MWDGDWAVLEEYTTGNVLVEQYLQGYHGLVKTFQNVAYYYQDELGSTSHIATATGALIESYQYDLYGKPRVYSSGGTYQPTATPVAKDLGNGGSRWLPELGLYDDRNRFMSPDLGRFIQPDPVGFKGDGSNLYRYCGNDWANRTDPMGLIGVNGPGGQDPADTGLYSQTFAMEQHASVIKETRLKQQGQQSIRGSLMGPLSGRVQTQQYRNPIENMGFHMSAIRTVTLEGRKVPAFDNPWAAGRYGSNNDYRSTADGGYKQEFWGTIQQLNKNQLFAASASKPGGQALGSNETKTGGTVHSAISHEKFGNFTMVGWHYSHIVRGDMIGGHNEEIEAANTISWMRYGVVAAPPTRGAWDEPIHQGYDGSTQKFIEEKDFR